MPAPVSTALSRRHLSSAAAGIGLLAATMPAQADPGTSYVYSVPSPTPAQVQLLHQLFDVGCGFAAAQPGADVEVVVMPEENQLFLALLPGARLLSRGRPYRDVAALQSGVDVPDSGYYTVAEIEAEIDAMVAAHPGRALKVDLSALPGGQPTHVGRSIFALKVSDNVAIDEDEPAIVLAAQHHARELMSPHMVIGAMQRVLNGYATDPALQAVVDGHELWFVPMVNPDGVDHVWNVDENWRKNRRDNGGSFGVDLNRNYPYLWGVCGSSTTPGSSIYRGPAPASEPETQTMRNLVDLLRPEIYLDFHSSGQEVLRMWAPCATVHATMLAFQQRYADDLRTPMGYSTRDPSGSGEAPEDHFSSGGTLSFLTEIGTTHQPVFGSAVVEEARVWPGIERALTIWAPALRGHVRSSLGNTPLRATITFSPNLLTNGEITASRARDGRYGMWLPLGPWLVTFSAPGHDSRTVAVAVAAYDSPHALDVCLEPSAAPATLTAVGTGQLGTTVTFTYTSPGDATKMMLFGWSLGTTPGLDLGCRRVIPLNRDFLFEAALNGNPFLAPTATTLDAGGQARSLMSIPNLPLLVGLQTFVAGITIDYAYVTGVKTWSSPVGVTVVP